METGPLWRAAAAIRNPVSRESGPGGDPRVSGVSAAVSRGGRAPPPRPRSALSACFPGSDAPTHKPVPVDGQHAPGSYAERVRQSQGVLPSAGRAAGVRWVVTPHAGDSSRKKSRRGRVTAAVTQQPMSDSTAMLVGILAGLATIALLTLVIAALASVLSMRSLTRGGKLLWTLLVLQLPILGAVAWFVIGRQGPLNSLLGLIKSGRHESPGTGEHVHDDLFETDVDRLLAARTGQSRAARGGPPLSSPSRLASPTSTVRQTTRGTPSTGTTIRPRSGPALGRPPHGGAATPPRGSVVNVPGFRVPECPGER